VVIFLLRSAFARHSDAVGATLPGSGGAPSDLGLLSLSSVQSRA